LSQIGGNTARLFTVSHMATHIQLAEASTPATNLLRIRGPGRKPHKATLRLYYIKVTGDAASGQNETSSD
jgi:hypothetical protein